MINKTLPFLMLLLSINVGAQQLIHLLTIPKPFTAFRKGTSSSIYSKAGWGPNINSLTPRVAMKQSDNGVIIKVDYDAYQFDLEGKKVWQIKLPDVFNLNDMPNQEIICGDGFTYFWESNNNPIKKFKASVIQVDPKGNKYENVYELDLKDKPYDLFVMDGNLCVQSSSLNKKNESIENVLHIINRTNQTVSTKKIELPFNAYEFQKAKGDKGNHYWNLLTVQGKDAIFYKAYFKDIEGTKKKKMVIQLLEMDGLGVVKNIKEILFEPEFTEDRKFYAPTIVFNPKSNSLIVLGYLEIDKNKVNGLYLLRYDYATVTLLDKKEFPFSVLLKPEIKTSIKTHYQIPSNPITAGTFSISEDDYSLDLTNDFISLRIITDYDLNSSSFFDVKFDKYGDHIQTGVSEFPGMVGYLRNIIMQPTKYETVWTDKVRQNVANAKSGSWNYINSLAKGEKDKTIFWLALSFSNKNGVVRFDEDNGQFDLIILK